MANFTLNSTTIRDLFIAIQDSVLEDTSKHKPFSTRSAYYLKLFTYIVIGMSLLTVLIYEAEFPLNMANGFTPLTMQVWVLFKALTHALYLYIVFNILVFSQPMEGLFPQHFVIPTLLLGAQGLYTLSLAFPRSSEMFRTASYGTFIALFLLWLIRDWGEGKNPEKNKAETTLWVLIEFVAIIIFIIFLRYPGFNSDFNESHINTKDLAVGMSVLFYLVVRLFHSLVKDENYASIYKRFKTHIAQLSQPNLPSITGSMDCVLDFGCGDGERLAQLLSWMKISPKEVYCYEKDSRWEKEFNARNTTNAWRFINGKETDLLTIAKKADLLYFSHVLYEEKTVHEIIRVIQNTKPNALVVFRGNGPKSIFVAISFIKSRSLTADNRSHIWIDTFLKMVIDQAQLVSVDCSKSMQNLLQPDCEVLQTYPIAYLHDLTDFLHYLYDDPCNDIQILNRFANLVRKVHGIDSLPCDDVLFFFRHDPSKTSSNLLAVTNK
ncbi:MAG: hypothetical protein NTY45_09650 [Elusimicrobia bacterium]|nr:hypothetical protein [Elusimicrobiota bacterium]